MFSLLFFIPDIFFFFHFGVDRLFPWSPRPLTLRRRSMFPMGTYPFFPKYRQNIRLIYFLFIVSTSWLRLSPDFLGSAPEGYDAPCPHHLHILLSRHVMLHHVTSRYVPPSHPPALCDGRMCRWSGHGASSPLGAYAPPPSSSPLPLSPPL